MVPTLHGFAVPVAVAGPEEGIVVVILGDSNRAPLTYDALCERLHIAALRTVVIGFDARLTRASVLSLVDGLGIRWAALVGDGAGGDLAWELAATTAGRFVGLVVIDRGHPRVADSQASAADADADDADFPPVRVDTTVLASSPAAREAALRSRRFVHSDCRLVDLVRRHGEESTAQLAAEIVLRTSAW
ncbi:MAG: alpha/beta hydrolase [Mycobacterium sp.]